LGSKLLYKNLEDWENKFSIESNALLTLYDRYRVTVSDFKNNRGATFLLHEHHGSPYYALKATYSDHEFLPWLFKKSAKNYFKKRENRQKYVEWLRNKMGVKRIEELKVEDFRNNGGGGLIMSFGCSPMLLFESLKATTEGNDLDRVDDLEHMPQSHWVLNRFSTFSRIETFLTPSFRSPLKPRGLSWM
jgi:hypothetical protein